MGTFEELLERVVAGDPEAVASFGLERRYQTGRFVAESGIYEWDQRMLLSGQGLARYVIHRSLGDGGGYDTGAFQMPFPPEYCQQTAAAILTSGILNYRPDHIEPMDVMIRLRLVALGEIHEVGLSMDNPPRDKAISKFLGVLGRIATEIQNYPLRTLVLEAKVEGPVVAGRRSRVPVLLRLVNTGGQGHWVTNPAFMTPDGVFERRYVTWAAHPKRVPGMSPVLSAFVMGPLEPVEVERDPEKALLWLGPESAIEVPCSAVVNMAEAGMYYIKAGFWTYGGGTSYQNQPRWLGAAFSKAIDLEAK